MPCDADIDADIDVDIFNLWEYGVWVLKSINVVLIKSLLRDESTWEKIQPLYFAMIEECSPHVKLLLRIAPHSSYPIAKSF